MGKECYDTKVCILLIFYFNNFDVKLFYIFLKLTIPLFFFLVLLYKHLNAKFYITLIICIFWGNFEILEILLDIEHDTSFQHTFLLIFQSYPINGLISV